MANIKLNGLAQSFNDKTPTNVSQLSNFEKSINILYKDIKFDLTDLNTSGIFSDKSINSNLSKKDLETLINVSAITKSVSNWFNTNECSRLLNPELSFNLTQYLFSRVDEYVAYFIGLEITEKLSTYEPRISIEKCRVLVDYENDMYVVELKITIPTLDNITFNLKGILSTSGFVNL